MSTVPKWKPGDVALVNVDGAWITGILDHNDDWTLAVPMDDSRGGWVHHDPGELEIRPLVVIDPEDREQVQRILDSLLGMSFAAHACGSFTCLQAALREFANPPPPIEEPTGWLAAVLDEEGDKWVRDGMSGDRSQSGHWWNYTVAAEKNYNGTLRADWHAIQVVRVLAEGVPSEVTP